MGYTGHMSTSHAACHSLVQIKHPSFLRAIAEFERRELGGPTVLFVDLCVRFEPL